MSEDLEIQCPYCLKQISNMPPKTGKKIECEWCDESYTYYQIIKMGVEIKPTKQIDCFVESPDEIQDLLGRIGQ